MAKKVLVPEPLKKGDVIRIVAASSPFEKDAFLAGVRWLESQGFIIRYRKDIFTRLPYLAGNDERRADELGEALADDDAGAILFARGGYGAMRLLPFMKKMRKPAKPKIIMGYSDVTSLLVYFRQLFNWATFYGPVVAKDISAATPRISLRAVKEALTTPWPGRTFTFSQAKVIREGSAKAEIVGGCLTLVNAHLGTPYALDVRGKILFLEDVNEKPYQIDRFLTQLRHAGVFDRCCGVLIGSMAGPNPQRHYQKTVADFFAADKFPVVMGLPFGHLKNKLCLPLGMEARMKAQGKQVTMKF